MDEGGRGEVWLLEPETLKLEQSGGNSRWIERKGEGEGERSQQSSSSSGAWQSAVGGELKSKWERWDHGVVPVRELRREPEEAQAGLALPPMPRAQALLHRLWGGLRSAQRPSAHLVRLRDRKLPPPPFSSSHRCLEAPRLGTGSQLNSACPPAWTQEKYGPKAGSHGSALKPKSSHPHKAADFFDLSIGLATSPPWNCSLCKVNATSYETLEGHSQGKKHRAKAKAAHAKLSSHAEPDFTTPNSDGNGKLSVETNGSQPVENGMSLPTLKGEEENVKKRKPGLAIDEGEKKVGDKRIKSSRGEEVLDAAAKEGIVSFENGGGAEESAAGIAQNGKGIKWRKHTMKVLLKAPEKSIKIKALLKELVPLVTSGADHFDKKLLEAQLVETLTGSAKFEVKGKWVALAKTP